MKESLRLDKYLADMGLGTRTEVKNYIKKGRVKRNGEVIQKPEEKINTQTDQITMDERPISYVHYEYYMLNKPAGCVSAVEDRRYPVVTDYILTKNRKDLFPVGRLDLDTEGLLLITNDGDLAHRLLSPKKHVGKTYYARVAGVVTEEDAIQFWQGVELEPGFVTSPADLRILCSKEESEVELTIYEGRFHQVKRMFEQIGKEVIYLKRLSMGDLVLDPLLEPGEYRPLSEEEQDMLNRA